MFSTWDPLLRFQYSVSPTSRQLVRCYSEYSFRQLPTSSYPNPTRSCLGQLPTSRVHCHIRCSFSNILVHIAIRPVFYSPHAIFPANALSDTFTHLVVPVAKYRYWSASMWSSCPWRSHATLADLVTMWSCLLHYSQTYCQVAKWSTSNQSSQ